MSDYLWDGSGSDPEVERLETVLAPLAYSGRAPELPRRRAPIGLFVATGLAAAAILTLMVWAPWRPAVFATTEGHAVTTGHWLETVTATRLDLGALGTVELGPSTRARMLGPGHLELDHGSLSAHITAPPRHFAIDTRYARLIDLGCAFQLTVDASGNGELLVTEGSVALAQGGTETVVPLGLRYRFDQAGISGPPAMPTEAPPVPKTELSPKSDNQRAPRKESHKSLPPKKNIAAPQNNSPAPQKNAPAPQKTDPGLKLHHDSLRDLERSAQ